MSPKKNTIKTTPQNTIESDAIYVALACGLIGLFTGLVLFQDTLIPIFVENDASLGLVATTLGAIVSFVVYLFSAFSSNHNSLKKLSTWTLALAHALLALLLYALFFYILGQSFKGAHMDTPTSAILTALSAGVMGYFSYLSASNMTTLRIAGILTLFLVVGIFTSMLTSTNPNWWQWNFSALGTGEGVSRYTFNGTMIIAGAMVIALSSFLDFDINRLKQAGKLSAQTRSLIMRIGLILIGISLAGVGIFIFDDYPTIHRTFGTGTAIVFGLILIGLVWIVPNFSKAFYIASYFILAILILSAYLFYGIGYFNLTALEMIVFGLVFTWLIIFVRHIAAMLGDKKLE